jgi:hypothetical protein
MNRKWLLASITGGAVAAAIACTYFAWPAKTPADPPKPADPPAAKVAAVPSETSVQLPIGQVVLFSSGVGYFQREGQIEGDARVDLSFPVSDINDLIKSMVLRDLDGGHISAVSYDSNAPVEKTLQSFAINLSSNPSFGQVLNQARGEKVEVVLQQANAAQPGTMTGSIMGVEQKPEAVDKAVVNVEQLNMWCADGLRSVKLSDVQRVRFLNPIMDNEVRKALETLTLSHDTQKKAVSLNFAGDGKRNVRVGYVIENPIWKTSYRLVLGKEKEDKPFLQGWAVVENPTDEDWKDVRMALVSGRPISFQMDLYTPLYVPRPTVVPELFASLRPVTYNSDLNARQDALALREHGELKKQLEDGAKEVEEARRGLLSRSEALAADKPTDGRFAGLITKDLDAKLRLGDNGVSTMATATKLGDFFQYAIDKPVTLPRQKSALLPIVNKDVQGARCSIYNERTQAKFPLLGLKFKNTSGLHLMQGPITVFEGSNYAGDARILDVEPNEERLISYAVDLGTEVNPVPSSDNGRLVQIKVVKGILSSATKVRETKTYTIVNRNDQERLVLVEHPVRNDFHLTDDTTKPAETASDVYRFEVKVPAGKTATQAVTEEKIINQQIQLTNSNDDQMRFFLNSTVSSQKVKDGLKQAIDLKFAWAKTQSDRAQLEKQLKDITDDQARLRANLKEMPPTAAAYKRYLDKFDAQETQIEKFQADIKKLQDVEHQQQKEFEDFLNNFSAE